MQCREKLGKCLLDNALKIVCAKFEAARARNGEAVALDVFLYLLTYEDVCLKRGHCVVRNYVC